MINQTRSQGRPIGATRAWQWLASARPFLLPIVITLLVAVGALWGPPALHDPGAGVEPTGASLEVGPAYLLLAPVYNVLDTLSLLTVGQHYAVLATLIALFVAWRVFRRRRTQRTWLRRERWPRRLWTEAWAAAIALAGLLAFYAVGVLVPRPMAALAVNDPDVVVVDFHSHTRHSHDGRPGFGPESRREWHRAAGFDVGYVSDHRTWDGWLESAPSNPQRAGDGTVLLPALEIRYHDMYVNALGHPSRYEPARDGNNLDPAEVARLSERASQPPTFVLSVFEVRDLQAAHTTDAQGIVALELTEAAPRGLRQSRRERALLVRAADSLNLAPVSASSHHGWGRTAAAWTLMRIPGWRRMAPIELNATIERTLHRERHAATQVVERHMPYFGETALAMVPTLPAITWQMFGGIGLAERVSWLFWSWGLALAVLLWSRARAGGTMERRLTVITPTGAGEGASPPSPDDRATHAVPGPPRERLAREA